MSAQKGQRCSADQNTLKRSDLDDLESPAVALHPLRGACYNPKNRHDRNESECLTPTNFEANRFSESDKSDHRSSHDIRDSRISSENEPFRSLTYEELTKRDP
jgi:hypothetical protein